MSGPDTKIPRQGNPLPEKAHESSGDERRDETLNRLRAALLKDRLAVVEAEMNSKNTGTDPYNSGIRCAVNKAHAWSKRSR